MLPERAIVDAYTRRALLLLRVANGTSSSAESRLRKLADELRRLLAGVDLSALGRRDLAALLRDIEAAIAACYDDIESDTSGDLDEVEDDEEQWAAALFGRRPKERSSSASSALLVLGLPLARIWQRQRSNSTDRITAIIRTAAGAGQGVDEVIRQIVGEGPRSRERGGALETDRTQGRTIVHTAVRAAAIRAQRRAWKAAGVRYLRWHSILDTRTTIGCAVRAGKIYTVDFEPVGHDIPIDQPPPRHWNCRSILVPMAPGWEPPGDGHDPYIESFDDWLQRQSRQVQDAMLGPTRAVLWRAGKITSRDLLGRGGESLTVAELRAQKGLSAYDVARAGGTHAGFLRNLDKLTQAQIEKSIKSNEKNIVVHKDKIANPRKYLEPGLSDSAVRRYTDDYWPKEIRKFQDEIDIAQEYLRGRKGKL